MPDKNVLLMQEIPFVKLFKVKSVASIKINYEGFNF